MKKKQNAKAIREKLQGQKSEDIRRKEKERQDALAAERAAEEQRKIEMKV